jgi:hypothetical protein
LAEVNREAISGRESLQSLFEHPTQRRRDRDCSLNPRLRGPWKETTVHLTLRLRNREPIRVEREMLLEAYEINGPG